MSREKEQEAKEEFEQCDQMAFTVLIIRPFTTQKNCKLVTEITKVGNKFGQILNKPSQNCQKYFSLCQRGKICQIWSHW